MLINHIHSSSRFDRSVDSLTRAATSYNQQAHLVTYTEVQTHPRKKALREVNAQMNMGTVVGSMGNHNDCAISFDKEKFSLLHQENYKASDLVYRRWNKKKTRPIFATIAVFSTKEDHKTFVVTVVHLPSSVESTLARKGTTDRTASWHANFRGIRKRTNKVMRGYRTNSGMIVADWNIDFRRPWARAIIKAIAPRWRLTWNSKRMGRGTRGHRVIDGTIVRGLRVVTPAWSLPDDNSSDHRPYKELLSTI